MLAADVRAAADRTVVELTSEAGRRSEIVRGEADAQRNAIYADAYGRDPEFFAFTRSLTSYQRALQGSNSSLVMQPDSEFFSYLSSDGAANANPASTPVPPGNSAERLGLNGPAETPEDEELVVPEVVDRDGNRLGESAGIELTPVPENLATPPQEPSEILSPDAPVEGAAQSEDAPAEEAPAPEAPAEDTAAEPTPAN